MHLYIHIGIHKTGTTTIQSGLTENRGWLAQRGYVYPRTGRVGTAQHNLAWEILRTKRYSRLKGTFGGLIHELSRSKADVAIISSEDFDVFGRSEIATVADKLKQIDQITILVYLRRQDQILQSFWSQNIKTGQTTKPFQQFMRRRAKRDIRLRYDRFLNRWAEVFGEENIQLRIFEEAVAAGHIFHDFLRACGVPDAEMAVLPESVNVSPSINTIEVIRYISDKLAGTLSNEHRQQLAREIMEFAQQNGWDQEKLNTIDREQYEWIMRHYETSNQAVAQAYFGRDELFQMDLKDKPISEPTWDFQQLLDLTIHFIKS